MSQRHRDGARAAPAADDDPRPSSEVGHAGVRVIPKELVPAALAASGRGSPESLPEHIPAVVRPARARDVRDVVPRLREHRAVVLELDRIEDDTQRRRAMDFAAGVAYGLEAGMSGVANKKYSFLLEPNVGQPRTTHDDGSRQALERAGHAIEPEPQSLEPEPQPLEPEHFPRSRGDTSPLCVLCDLRRADDAFESPLDMVIRRDGSRILSPPALVCTHCRETIRHWRFVLGWCPECERWGRRNVMSPCGIPYGT